MNILEKIENAINFLLIKLTELIARLIPRPVKVLWQKIERVQIWLMNNFRKIPDILKNTFLALVARIKTFVSTVNVKSVVSETSKKALAQTKLQGPKGIEKFKTILLAPFLVIGQWLNGLTAGQSMLLLTFSSASFLAIIGVGFSGQKIMSNQLDSGRSPASTEEDVEYERPAYYKKQIRHMSVTNLRLPVYIAQVNEIKSVDIDFSATMSNRYSKNYLEKHEFHLRDHLILQMEPSVATFPLEQEGREIIREKLLKEINEFLKQSNVEGEVIELEITYVLAN